MGRDSAVEEGVDEHAPEQFVSQYECWHGYTGSLGASPSLCRSAAAKGGVQWWVMSWLAGGDWREI